MSILVIIPEYNKSLTYKTMKDKTNYNPIKKSGYTNYNPTRKSQDYVYGVWVCKLLGIWNGYYRVKKNHQSHAWNRETGQEMINILYEISLQNYIHTLI